MKRINSIASLIQNKEALVADIGSDHAFLAIKLLKNKQAKTIYNVEINKLPLEFGIKNLKANFCYDNTVNVINNGLSNWKLTNYFDYVCISGMGGKNIIDILANVDPNLKIKYLILSPNNNAYELRKYLAKHDWKFVYENVIYENKYYYPIIEVCKDQGIKYTSKYDWYFGKLNLQTRNDDFINMIKQRKQHISKLSKFNEEFKKELEIINEIDKK